MTTRRFCRVCGDDTGSAEFSVCGRASCQRAALGPGADDVRLPCPGPLRTSDELEILGEGCDDPDPVAPPAPARTLSDRLRDAARRREQVHREGIAELLSRCATFGPEARPQAK